MKKAFTITELLLAISLMVVLMATSGVVFQTAVKAHRTASATAEIARKLRGITDQLNADFKGLRKDGKMLVIWIPSPVDVDGNPLGATAGPAQIDRYERFDRVMFFADGDFQSYNEWPTVLPPPALQGSNIVHGNLARIGYMLAKNAIGDKAQIQQAAKRTLARSQHIFASDIDLVGINTPPDFPLDATDISGTFDLTYNNMYEYENLTMGQWLNLTLADEQEVLTIISDVVVDFDPLDGIAPVAQGGGLTVDPPKALNIHNLLCQGAGEFSIQGWYEDPLDPTTPRWFPQLDLTPGDGVITDQADTDFVFDPAAGRIHAKDVRGQLYVPGGTDFNSILGLGRALKFTFTLYDSKGVFKEGKKFTHIVYLDD